MLIFAVAIILYLHLYRKSKKKEHIKELKEMVPVERAQKIERELAALESAFKSGFISEESYKKDKERLEKELQRLKAGKPKEQTKEEAKKPEEKAADKPRAINGEEKTAEEIVKEAIKEDKEKPNE